MPDVSLWTTLISSGGAVLAGMGGVAMTLRGAIRRDAEQAEQQLRRDAAQAERQQHEQRADARRQVGSDLAAAAMQFRVQVQIACQRQWRDMNTRVYDIQQRAIEVGLYASRVALLGGPEVSEATRSFTEVATSLAAALVRNTKMGDITVLDKDSEAGYVEPRPDFTEFDARLDRLCSALAAEIKGMDPGL
jgi:hypothetical protein